MGKGNRDTTKEQFLCIYLMLMDRPMTTKQIIRGLYDLHGIRAEKKSVWSDLHRLECMMPLYSVRKGQVPYYALKPFKLG